MHSIPVMISTVTQAHTVSEGVGVEQASWICRCILCMHVEKCIKVGIKIAYALNLPSKIRREVQGAVLSYG